MKKTNLNKIVYIDKQNFQELPTIPIYQKATASDFNQIKNIVNSTIDELNLNVSPELESLNNSTVKLNGNQNIDGEKTFIQNLKILNKQIILSVEGNNSTFLEFLKDGVRIGFFGKGSSSSSNLTLSANNDLIFSGSNINFSGKPLKKIGPSVNSDDATQKIYVDTIKQNLDNDVSSTNLILNDLIKEVESLKPFIFKGDYSNLITYSKGDVVEDLKDFLYISIQDNNLNNPLSNTNFWKNFGPKINLEDYYTKLETDQQLNLKQNKLTAGENISIINDTINSTILIPENIAITNLQNNFTVNQTITDSILKMNVVGNNSAFLEFLKDGVRIGFFGKGSSSSSNLTLSSNNDLILSGANIRFSDKELKDIAKPTIDSSATNKKYVDDKNLLKADKTEIDTINVELEVNSTNISENAANILLKADKTEIAIINTKILSNTTNITKNTDDILLKSDKNFVDEEFVKTNTSITNLAKSVDILVGDYAVSWASKTTNTSAGTNLKTLFGDELWNEIILPANKYKYILKCYTGASSSGNYYSLPLNCINQVDTGSQKITLFGACNINAMRFNDPANRTTINATLMVNNIGDVRLYVLFGTALNANFSVGNIKLFRRQLIV